MEEAPNSLRAIYGNPGTYRVARWLHSTGGLISWPTSVGLTLIWVVPPSAWADGKLAELAEQLGKMVENPKSKSTQPRFARRWVPLYRSVCPTVLHLDRERLLIWTMTTFPEFPQLHNGLHGSASPDSAEQEIEIVFPHILHGTNDNAGYNNIMLMFINKFSRFICLSVCLQSTYSIFEIQGWKPHTRPYGLLVNEACVTRNWPKTELFIFISQTSSSVEQFGPIRLLLLFNTWKGCEDVSLPFPF